MGTTVSELADKLGVSKQTIRRYVKQELGLKTEPRKALQLDVNQAAAVANHFEQGKVADSGNGVAIRDAELEQNVATRDAELEQKIAALEQRVSDLERERDMLQSDKAYLQERLAQSMTENSRLLEGGERKKRRGLFARLRGDDG